VVGACIAQTRSYVVSPTLAKNKKQVRKGELERRKKYIYIYKGY
jgi:hypothetical protein